MNLLRETGSLLIKLSGSTIIENMKLESSIKNLVLLPALAMMLHPVFSQETLKSLEEEYFDFLSIQGLADRSFMSYRTLSDSKWILNDESHVWNEQNTGTSHILFESENPSENFFTRGINQNLSYRIYGPDWYNSFNTKVPYGQNDSALWQGKGFNSSLTGGARLEGYGFEVTLKPQLTFSQNLDYTYKKSAYESEYGYFSGGGYYIDMPQRFGDSAYYNFDWGDSEIRYTWHNLTAGFGTQNVWLGPAWLNPIMSSNNAAGFPKVDVGLRKTKVTIPKLGWYLGDIEARLWMGKLYESDYFDSNSDNDERLVNSMMLSYSPSFLKGFTVGASRTMLTYWGNFSLKYMNPFYSPISRELGNIDDDKKISLFADYVIPAGGIEIYGEYAIDDGLMPGFWTVAPEHASAYTIGAKKTLSISEEKKIYGELIFEHSDFELSKDYFFWSGYSGFYFHYDITQGYTNKGQIVGAGTGYSGNSQYLGFRLFYPKGSSMISLHRHVDDSNYNFNKAVGLSIPENLLDNEAYIRYCQKWRTAITLGLSTDYFLNQNLRVGGSYELTRYQFYMYEDSPVKAKSYIYNNKLSLWAKYNF